MILSEQHLWTLIMMIVLMVTKVMMMMMMMMQYSTKNRCVTGKTWLKAELCCYKTEMVVSWVEYK